MKFTSNFLRFTLLIVLIALFSCVQVAQSVRNDDSKLGYCSYDNTAGKIPLAKKLVHRKNNQMFRVFRKNNWTVRFPEVNSFIFIYFKFLLLLSARTDKKILFISL